MNVGFFLYLLAVSAEGGGSRARDQIHPTATTPTTAVKTPDLNLLSRQEIPFFPYLYSNLYSHVFSNNEHSLQYTVKAARGPLINSIKNHQRYQLKHKGLIQILEGKFHILSTEQIY